MQSELIPALDLIDGKVVRLFKGDYTRQQAYIFNPLEKLKEYEKEGAKTLHLVDLSGARDPSNRQLSLLASLAKSIRVRLQVGGGVRSRADVKSLLDVGATRVVLGSLALTEPNLCAELLEEFGSESLVFALDVLPRGEEHLIALNAWQDASDKELFTVLESYVKKGLRHLLCTDISRDGTMSGANTSLYTRIKQYFPMIYSQASGGVASLADLQALRGVCSGIIVGKALLDGVFSVREGIAQLANNQATNNKEQQWQKWK